MRNALSLVWTMILAGTWAMSAFAAAPPNMTPEEMAEVERQFQQDGEEPQPAKKSQANKDTVDKSAAKTPESAQAGLDNSRTDINLFNKIISDKNKVKSLFFTQEEISDIYLAVNTYLKFIGRGGDLTFDEEAFLSRLGGLKDGSSNVQSRFFTYPQFYLDSLVYHGPNNWIVWVNGEKITQDTPKESNNIHVISIDADKITIEWFPLSMDRVLEVWKKFPNETVKVNRSPDRVEFVLKPNQTFSSYVMKVLEGKVLPVTVDTTQVRQFLPLEGEKEEPSPAAAPQDDDTSREGLTGLINSYEKLNKGAQ